MAFGYKEYVSFSDRGNKEVEQRVINNAIDSVKENFHVSILPENCSVEYDLLDQKEVYNKPLHHTLGFSAFDKDHNFLGFRDEIDIVDTKIALRVYLKDSSKAVPTLL
ncbi:hypothetical protein SP15_253 [Bacillus phage SP-15]|uniref:Uncharacterized protein n=1 Tax=Bacillus phage SP-15 TaxID=1792032 RepID=A0A127AWI3_9CAUD|nr:hypothetical protein SP15_253 [Bacillus phage SP-15]AMM45059.1 hypothetical protein SP15_253 [Bacillus phage SP-15]